MRFPGRCLRLLAALCALALLLLAAACVWGWRDYSRFAEQPLFATDAVTRALVVEPGDSFTRVLRKLRDAGAGQAPKLYWQLLARELNVAAANMRWNLA